MAELSASIYQLLNQREVPLDPFGAMQQGQRSALGQMALQEARRQQQVDEQVRARLRQAYAQGGTTLGQGTGMLPTPGMPPGPVQETVNTPYSSDLQAMLSQYQQEGADVTPTPGARVLPGAGPPAGAGQPPAQGAAPQAGGITPEVIRQVGMIDPQAAFNLEKVQMARQSAALDMHLKQNSLVSNVARAILMDDTQAGYERGVAQLRQYGIPVDHLPRYYDRRMVEQYEAMASSREDELQEAQAQLQRVQARLAPRKLALEERTEARLGTQGATQEERLEAQRLETERHNLATERIARDAAERGWTAEQRQAAQDEETKRHNRRMEDLQASTAERTQKQAQAAQENTLRDEFEKETTTYKEVRDSWGRIQAVGTGPQTPQNDYALIYSFMKMLDPATGIRDAEVRNAIEAGGLPAQTKRWLEWVQGNKILPPEVQKEFLETSKRLYEQYTREYEATRGEYNERAKRAGVNPENVTRELRARSVPRDGGAGGPPAPPGDLPPQQAAPARTTRQRISRTTVDRLATEEKVPRATVIQRLRDAGLDVEN